MNSLSWLLYIADAVENVRIIAGISAGALGMGLVVTSIFAGMTAVDDGKDAAAPTVRIMKAMALWLVLPALLLAVSPSRNTIMLIAASEVGETVLASDQAQKIGGEAGALATDSLKVLRKFINDQLGEAAE